MMRIISGGGGNETTMTTVEAESEEASSATATSSAASASLRRPSAVLRLRSPAVDAPKPAKIPLFSFASLPSPFVSLTVFSALVLLLVPSEFLLPAQRAADQTAVEDDPRKGGDFFAFLDPSEEFSCGGGPLSYLAASMISISCDRHSIHLCCEIHDECYEFRHINQTVCDDQFCSCLDTIRSSAYCETVAQPGLCLATRTFGHLFHWSSNCTAEAVEANGGQLPPECSMLLGQPPPDVANQPQLEIVVAVDEQPEVRGKEAKQQHKTGSGTSRETGIDS